MVSFGFKTNRVSTLGKTANPECPFWIAEYGFFEKIFFCREDYFRLGNGILVVIADLPPDRSEILGQD